MDNYTAVQLTIHNFNKLFHSKEYIFESGYDPDSPENSWLNVNTTQGDEVRLPIGGWIVEFSDGRVYAYSDEDYQMLKMDGVL